MIAYKFDGTTNGLLTCIFDSFTNKETPFLVTSNDVQLEFGLELKTIVTDTKKAEKVEKGIIKYGSISLLKQLYYVLRSNDSLKENVVFSVAHKCLQARKDISLNYADCSVATFRELYQKIKYEVHRYKGFIRFEESVDGILYSHFEPDNDICDLLAPHFISRLGSPFFLHDVKRNIATLSDGKTFITKKLNSPVAVYLSAKEMEMKKMWKEYYDSVTISQRKNLRQMKAYMPVRYYKHLPEKSLLTDKN